MFRQVFDFFIISSWNLFLLVGMYQQRRLYGWKLCFRFRSLLCVHVSVIRNISGPITKPFPEKDVALRFSDWTRNVAGYFSYGSVLVMKNKLFRVNTCGATVTNNCTYIQNPAYPSSESSGSCSFSVQPLNSDICQLRLDFDNFDLTETSTNVGTCVDTFDVTSGSSRDYFSLCGTLTGQHMYMETGRKTTDQTLSFTIATTSTVATWRIKVNQISCFSLSKAPNDCLQYHTGVSGEISSLNYPTVMLADIWYSICIRREHGYCGAEWSLEASTSPDSFVLDRTITTTSFTDVAAIVANSVDATSSDAYIAIPGAYAGIYGGGIFSDETVIVDTTSGTVQTYGVPLRVNVNTYDVGSSVDIGFNLVYNQIPCGANINSDK